jgi:putative endonuclease
MFFTYILFSEKLKKYYIGSTNNIENRILRHNGGTEKFTSTGIPWQLKYFETFSTLAEARKRELEIKKKKSRKYIEWLIAVC